MPDTITVDLTESRATEIYVVAWLFTGIAIVIVVIKLFARSRITKQLGWDDFFIFFSLALSIVAAALVTYSVELGLGRHTQAVVAESGTEQLIETARWQILGYPFNIGAFSFPNISIAILVVKLLDPHPVRSRCLYALVILQVVFALVSVVLIFLQCTPTARLWNATIDGTCWSPDIFNNYSYWVSAYTTLTDIILAVVPISVFWRLQMRTTTRLGVCIMMGLTLISAVVTIIKATYLHLFTDRTDPLFNVVPLVLWGLVEQNVVIVAACIPTLKPFFHKAFNGDRSGRSDRSNPSASKGSKLSSKLSSKAFSQNQTNQDLESASEVPLDDVGPREYAESSASQKGILRTLSVSMEWKQDSNPSSKKQLPSYGL